MNLLPFGLRFWSTVLIAVCLAGCIPAPLPSVVPIKPKATVIHTAREKNRSPVILLAGVDDSSSTLLGSQYLLGIIPFTAIRGENVRIVGEALREELEAQGAVAILTETANLNEKLGLTGASGSIEFRIKSISVNAFDLFFVRKLSVTGRFEIITSKMPGKSTAPDQEIISFDRSRTARFGFLPELASLLQTTIRTETRPAISRLLEQIIRSGR